MKPVKIEKSMSFDDVLKDVVETSKQAYETYKTNGGMCQHCGKYKAEYPNGLNPYDCKKCNEEVDKILKELKKCKGFVHLSR